MNLPFSKQHGDFYWHWNGGVTWLPRAEAQGPASIVLTDRADLLSPSLAGSAIYALRPMLHLMLENVLLFERSFDGIGQSRDTLYTLSPGLRGGWNVGDAQIVTARRCRSRGAVAVRHRRVSVFFVRAAVPEEMTAAPCLAQEFRRSEDQKNAIF